MMSFIFGVASLVFLGSLVALGWSFFKKKENKAKIGKICAGAFLVTGLTSGPAYNANEIKQENQSLKQELKRKEAAEIKDEKLRIAESVNREIKESKAEESREKAVQTEKLRGEKVQAEKERVQKEQEQKEREQKEQSEARAERQARQEELEREALEQQRQLEREAEAQQQAPQGLMSNPNSGGTESNQGSSGITGYCKDGTPASGDPSARGKANSCYGHGGWVR